MLFRYINGVEKLVTFICLFSSSLPPSEGFPYHLCSLVCKPFFQTVNHLKEEEWLMNTVNKTGGSQALNEHRAYVPHRCFWHATSVRKRWCVCIDYQDTPGLWERVSNENQLPALSLHLQKMQTIPSKVPGEESDKQNAGLGEALL